MKATASTERIPSLILHVEHAIDWAMSDACRLDTADAPKRGNSSRLASLGSITPRPVILNVMSLLARAVYG